MSIVKKLPSKTGRRHTRRRHRDASDVPRDERDDAIERFRHRHPKHFADLLWSAKEGMVFAKFMDSTQQVAEWCRAASRLVKRFPRLSPRAPATPVKFTFELPEPDGTLKVAWGDYERFLAALRKTLDDLKWILDVGLRAHVSAEDAARIEMVRDLHLMSGASLYLTATKHKVKLTAEDFADAAIAIGLERHDPDGSSAEARWYKRMPAIRALALDYEIEFGGERPIELGPMFFEPV